MCKAIEGIKEKVRNEGRIDGILETLAGLVKDNILPLAEAVKRANMTVDEFKAKTGLET